MALAFHADNKGLCWPSIQTLMRECNLCERAVQSQIRHLSRLGFVQVEQGGGKHRVNHYTVSVPNPAPDTVYQKPRMPNPVSRYPNPAGRSSNPAPDAPQLSGTARNGQGGRNGQHPPAVFDKELHNRIKLAEDEINEIKLKGNLLPADSEKIKELRKKQRQWKDELLSR